jgi:hypothetical protein
MAILLRREGLEVVPVYCSHRHGGNVTKKEVVVASRLADEVCKNGLRIVKKGGSPAGSEQWYHDLGEVYYDARLPIRKSRKDRRNRIMLRIVRDLFCEEADHYGLASLGPEGEAELIEDLRARQEPLSKQRLRDCDHESIENDVGLEPGVLVTPASLGIPGKAELVRAVGRYGRNADLLYGSESCLMYFNKPCGNCASCLARVRAFLLAWGEDRTPYRKGSTADKEKRSWR